MENVKIPIGSCDAKAIVCNKWVTNQVGVYMEIPLGHLDSTKLHATWAKYAIMKGLKTYFKANIHGLYFNIAMQTFGMSGFELRMLKTDGENIGHFIIEFKCKAHKVGQAIGLMYAAMLQIPLAGDISHPVFKGNGLNVDNLNAIAYNVYDAMVNKCKIAIITTTKNAVKDDWGEKAKKTLDNKHASRNTSIDDILKKLKSGKSIKTTSEYKTDGYEIFYDISKFKSPHSILFLNQILDGHLDPNKGKAYMCFPEFMGKYRESEALRVMKSLPSITRMCNDFIKVGKSKGKVDDKTVALGMAMVAVASHLPLKIAFAIASNKTSPDAKTIHSDLKTI